MAVSLKYHRLEDRMTIGFTLPEGQQYTCWITRRQWLFLILRLSNLDDLPKQVLGKYDASQVPLESQRNIQHHGMLSENDSSAKKNEEGLADSDGAVLIERIGVLQVGDNVRVSFSFAGGDAGQSFEATTRRLTLTLSAQECASFEYMLRARAIQAGWDLEAGLKRLIAYARRQQFRSKHQMH